MLKTLVKKQFLELFRSYFYNAKKGKANSKGKVALYFAAFALVMVFLAFAFFGMSILIGPSLFGTEYEWLYFTLMGFVAMALGTFGSVFNTYASLYLAKDNDFLLSMPIRPKDILASRMVAVYGMALLYSAVVWIPCILFYWINASPSIIAIIFEILITFLIALFVTFLTCVLGWLVALLSVKLKNKSIFTVIFSLVFFCVYYAVCFRMTDIIESLVANTVAVGNTLKVWTNLLYQMSMGACGNVLAMLIFAAVCVVLFAACLYVLSKSFVKIVTVNKGEKKQEYKEVKNEAAPVSKALLRREWMRYLSSSTYILNCTIGALLYPVLAVFMLFKGDQLLSAVELIGPELPVLVEMFPMIVILAMGLILGMNNISTPSISLEGKTLWLIRSLPVKASDVLYAKRNLHLYICAVPGIIGTILMCLALKIEYSLAILMTVYMLLYLQINATIGLMIGLARPNFTWVNETTPIKQSLNALITIVIGWVIPLITAGGFYLAKDYMDINNYMIIWIVVFALCSRLSAKWFTGKGSELFNAL